MSDFTTEGSIVSGLAACVAAGFSQDLYKATITTVSGFDYSGWTAGGNPVGGATPTTWTTPTKDTAGALNPRMVNPAAGKTCRTRRRRTSPYCGSSATC